jgi:hypothetical protein
MLNIAEFAPMATASVMIVIAKNPGLRPRLRSVRLSPAPIPVIFSPCSFPLPWSDA